MALRTATADDYLRFYPGEEPECWFGLSIVSDDAPVAIGLVYYAPRDGRWWISFQGPSRPLSMQKGARELLGFAREQNMALHALADGGIAGSLRWMAWWGFVETDEQIEGHSVYRWDPK